jgi:PAS domain S-box-containing protein
MTALSSLTATDPELDASPNASAEFPSGETAARRRGLRRMEGWTGYVLAIALVAVALALRLGVHLVLADRIPYLPFVVAAVIASSVCGLGPSLLVLVSTIVIQAVFAFLPGENAVEQVADLIALALFVAAGLAIVLISDSRQQAHLLADRHLNHLRVKTAELQAEVGRRRAIEHNLRASEGRFRTLAESLPQIVFTTTPDGRLDYCNARWYDYTGLDFTRTRNHGWMAAVHPDDRDVASAAWAEAAASGRLYETEYRLRRKDGVDRWHLARALPIRNDQGRIDLWIGSITDIDDARRYTENLERTVRTRTELLERSNRDLEQFAYVASHDLQEPLRKIQAFSDRLARRNRDQISTDGVESLDRILASASRMRSLINDLLSFSRVTTKSLPFTEVNLDVVAREVLVDLEERIAEAHATVDLGDLPTLQADPLQIRQLLQNLLGNALKFRKPGEPARVEVAARLLGPSDGPTGKVSPGGWCELAVTDHGIGFEPEYADRIFQVFQRLHGRGQFEGTGVGLAISKKIVERHGGTIEAQGRPGDGATFVVCLPLRQEPAPSHDPFD